MKIWKTNVLIFLIAGTSLSSITFDWKSRRGESGFALDVPSDWLYEASVRSNGAIIKFSNQEAEIEVRSFIVNEGTDRRALINAKAARLAAYYGTVSLLEERESKYDSTLYRATWQASGRKTRFIDETGFIMNGNSVLIVSCLVPASTVSKYKVICENALFSIRATEGEPAIISELAKFTFTNLPQNNRSAAENKTVPVKLPEAPKTLDDKFLPPVN